MTHSTTHLRQAAILVSTLDRALADALLDQLDPDDAERVRRAVVALPEIEPDEQREALEAFFRSSRPAPSDSGVELDPSLISRFAASAAVAQEANEPVAPLPPFQFLADVDAESLALALRQEQPQVIAVVASHLSREQAAQLLAALSSTLQAEVLARLAHLDELDPETILELERHLEAALEQHVRKRQRHRAGVAAVVDILSAAAPDTKRTLLANLEQRDRQLASRIAVRKPERSVAPVVEAKTRPTVTAAPKPLSPAAVYSFAELAELPPAALRTLFREADPEVARLALAGADEKMTNRVLAMFPASEAALLRTALGHLGPTRLSDVTAAQDQLAELAGELEQAGRIVTKLNRLSVAA